MQNQKSEKLQMHIGNIWLIFKHDFIERRVPSAVYVADSFNRPLV